MAAVALACLLVLAAPAVAAGATDPAAQLAARYSPIVVLKDQTKPCDDRGEAYRPVNVGVVLGRDDVVLRGPGGYAQRAPTARQLDGKDIRYYLDFPGDPLRPGCSYERWFDRISKGKPTTVYAHVVTEPGKPGRLALQYWLYYVYNDWNNKHEGDWEMLQLVFPADSAAEALHRQPLEVGYSQHSGAQRSAWNDPKLHRKGTHPLVYAAAGSHAQFFDSALWFGYSAEAGVGCDDTRGPSHELDPKVVLLPNSAPAADSPFAWLGFGGLWGQRLRSPNGGPTGPNAKRQWDMPTTWAQTTWRDTALSVPGGRSLGPSATGFFCGAVAAGSRVYLHALSHAVGRRPGGAGRARGEHRPHPAHALVRRRSGAHRPPPRRGSDVRRGMAHLQPEPAHVHRSRSRVRAAGGDRRRPAVGAVRRTRRSPTHAASRAVTGS